MNSLTAETIRTPTSSQFPSELKLLGTPAGLKNTKATSKHREHEPLQVWQMGWWDVEPLISGKKPPLQWTNSSVILSAHPTQPQVVCLLFPSNRQFSLPSPPTFNHSMYEPPTTIIASGRGDCIFAYFPGVDEEGVGCIWRKGVEVDTWAVKEFWKYPRGEGVVTARWTQQDREWVTSDTGMPSRLPMLGPFLPLTKPVLIVVTESHLCCIHYHHPETDAFIWLTASLRRQCTVKYTDARSPGERVEGPRGIGRCMRASIGFGYDEATMIIASQSTNISKHRSEATHAPAVDLSMPISVPMASPQAEPVISAEWNSWSTESTIELCEVTISIQGISLGLVTNPLPPLRGYPGVGSILTDLVLIPTLPNAHQQPSTPVMTHRNVTPMSSPAISNAHVSQSPGRPPQRTPIAMKGTPPKLGTEKPTKGNICILHLVCASLNVNHYSGRPKSDLTLFTLMRGQTRNEAAKQVSVWLHKKQASHSFSTNVISYLRPYQSSNSPQMIGIMVGLLNSEGPIRKINDGKQLEAGEFIMLRVSDLQADETWNSSKMTINFSSEESYIPFGFAVSPNNSLIASVSPSLMTAFATSATMIHNHPSKVTFSHDNVASKSRKHYATSLGISVHKRAVPNDILRSLTAPSVPIHAVEDIIMSILLENEQNSGFSSPYNSPFTFEIIGLAIDIYRLKGEQLKAMEEKEDCESRSSVGHDICSMVYCNRAWEDCSEGEGYDLDAIWNLLGVSSWTMEFLGKILKEIVYFSSESFLLDGTTSASAKDTRTAPHLTAGPDVHKGDPFASSGDPLESDMEKAACANTYYNLFHILHPFPLECVIRLARHVARLRLFLTMISAKSERTQMSKMMLLDIVDSSGINLEALVKKLMEARADVKGHSERAPDVARRCLASLKPHHFYWPMLRKISASLSSAVDKSRLFIKAEEMIDKMEGLSINSFDVSDRHGSEDRDVITKRYLFGTQYRTCLRCNGRTEIPTQAGAKQFSRRWLTFERLWASHCFCGGLWTAKRDLLESVT